MKYKFFAVDECGLASGHGTLDNAVWEAQSVAGIEPNLYGEVMRCYVCSATEDGQPDMDDIRAVFDPVPAR